MKKTLYKSLLIIDLWVMIVCAIVFPLLYKLDGRINMMALAIVISLIVSLNVISLIILSIKNPKLSRISKKGETKNN